MSRIPETPVLLLYVLLAITLVGQLPGYIRHYAEKVGFLNFAKGIPSLIPHEFQWFFQLFILVFMAWAFLDISYRLTEKKHSVIASILIFFLVLPGYIALVKNNIPVCTVKESYDPPDYALWTQENTDKNAVFVVSNYNILIFGFLPHTARKILYSDAGYMNYNVDTEKREKDKNIFLHSADRMRIAQIAGKYDIEYCLITKGQDISESRLIFFRKNFNVMFETDWEVIFLIQ